MQRRFRIPSPPSLGLAAADGAGILNEDPDQLGVVLWDLARDVLKWAGAPNWELGELRVPSAELERLAAIACAGADAGLTRHLEMIARAVGDPCGLDRRHLSLTCASVSAWADAQHALATAAVFAQAAASVCPGDAELAYRAGRLARRRADYPRAELWLKRAILLGRQSENWETYGAGFASLGNLFVQRGNYPKARKYHSRCLWAARRHELRSLEGDALHNLCVIAIHTDQLRDVNRFAKKARNVMHRGDPRLPILAHDVASAWMNQGLFAQALQVFEATRPFWRPDDLVIGLANICRSSAGAGQREKYERAWTETWACIESHSAHESLPQAVLDLAVSAASLDDWERAEMAARHSLALAFERREARVRLAAEAMLESVAHERAAGLRSGTPADPEVQYETSVLAEDLIESLTLCAAAG